MWFSSLPIKLQYRVLGFLPKRMRNKCLQCASVLPQMSRTIKATAGMKSAGLQPTKAVGGWGGLVGLTYSPVLCRQWNSVRSKRVDGISLRLSRVKHRCLLNAALSIPSALTAAWAGHIGDAHLFGARVSCMHKCWCAHMHSCPCSAVKTSGR